eukprot:8546676-Pyramimonas_sp.AAC.1
MSTAASTTHPVWHRALRQGVQAVKCPRQRGALAAVWSNVVPLPYELSLMKYRVSPSARCAPRPMVRAD